MATPSTSWKEQIGADEAERFLIDQVIVARVDVATIAEWLERHLARR